MLIVLNRIIIQIYEHKNCIYSSILVWHYIFKLFSNKPKTLKNDLTNKNHNQITF